MRLKQTRILLCLVLVAFFVVPSIQVQAKQDDIELVIIETVVVDNKAVQVYAIPPVDNSSTNPYYELLGFHWYSTISYYVNPSNSYGFSTSGVISVITLSANTWDTETSYQVFSYQGTTTRKAGRYDGRNVVSFSAYKNANAIAVTFIWYIGTRIIETDCIMNTMFTWSLRGEAGKMDVQNIMTHEFGHWCGLADLYSDVDYWLTMYGYGDYGETYKRTLGLGDINGLQKVYGP